MSLPLRPSPPHLLPRELVFSSHRLLALFFWRLGGCLFFPSSFTLIGSHCGGWALVHSCWTLAINGLQDGVVKARDVRYFHGEDWPRFMEGFYHILNTFLYQNLTKFCPNPSFPTGFAIFDNDEIQNLTLSLFIVTWFFFFTKEKEATERNEFWGNDVKWKQQVLHS